jgi:hypothetical protein
MTTITLAISDELKTKMRNFEEINWSGLVRKTIEEKVQQLQWKERMLKQLEEEHEETEWTIQLGRNMKEIRLQELKKKGIIKK